LSTGPTPTTIKALLNFVWHGASERAPSMNATTYFDENDLMIEVKKWQLFPVILILHGNPWTFNTVQWSDVR